MMSSDSLGTEKVKKLLFSMGWPAAMNFLVVTVYNLTDAIFVGKWLGPMQIAAVVVVGTVYFLFSAFGLVIGVGGSSIIARALGEKDKNKAAYAFGNQNLLVLLSSFLIVLIGWIGEDFILRLFGANGAIFPYASAYYRILLFGIPFTSWSSIGNSVIHTEGKAKVAMFNNLVPTIINMLLNPLFIKVFDLGIEGSAWATLVAYILGFLLSIRFFISGMSEINFNYTFIKFKPALVREIGEIGGSTLVNMITSNLFIIVLNQVLFTYEQESGVVLYGIINRVNMLLLIPIIGIDGAIRPTIGYNFGSQRMERIREAINTAMKYGLIVCYGLLGIVSLSADYFIHLFTDNAHLIAQTPLAMRVVFSFFPLIMIQTITNAYFQSIGKPQVAFYLSIQETLFY